MALPTTPWSTYKKEKWWWRLSSTKYWGPNTFQMNRKSRIPSCWEGTPSSPGTTGLYISSYYKQPRESFWRNFKRIQKPSGSFQKNSSDSGSNRAPMTKSWVENATQGFTINQSMGAIFLGVSKALDHIWHESLIFKMREAEYSRTLTKLLRNYLKNKRFQIKLNMTKSEIRWMEARVP